jgi:uncharacterized protein (TIGR03083 family)
MTDAKFVTTLDALRSSVTRLRALGELLDDDQLAGGAYPAEWTIADVLSHLGSGAVIQQRRLEDELAGRPTPDDFPTSVWDAWNAKSARMQADDALAADQGLVDRIDSLSERDRERVQFALGPLTFDLAGLISLRLNEHALHSWDLRVVLDPAATLLPEAAGLIIDGLDLIARYTAKPTGDTRTITVHTSDPRRQFTVDLTPDAVTFARSAVAGERSPDLSLPAEAFIRLVYGRLDAEHTPGYHGDPAVLDTLRRVFPGP